MEALLFVPVTVSILPALTALAYVARGSLDYWLAALVGGGGWFLALMARGPLFTIIDRPGMYSDMFMALVSGPLEEPVRFLLLRYFISGSRRKEYALVIGIGWGLAEAVIVFAAQAPVAASLGYSWIQLLPGALERNTAILFHVSMSMLIALGIMGRLRQSCSVILAIIVHSAFNLAAVYIAKSMQNVWLVEAALLVVSLAIFTPIINGFRRLPEDLPRG